MKAYGNSNVGKIRKNNEDSFHCNEESKLFIVADGLGGHSKGEVASQMAVSHIASNSPESQESLHQLVNEANNEVYQEARKRKNDMATTVSALQISGNQGFISHVGDSRIYLVRSDSVYCITSDHTPVMDSLRAGLLTEEQARNHPMKHMLSRTVGTHSRVEVDSINLEINPEDTFVLCTDGLSNLVEEEEIYFVVRNEKEPEPIVNALIEMALERGGTDNVTVVSVKVESEDLPEISDEEYSEIEE